MNVTSEEYRRLFNEFRAVHAGGSPEQRIARLREIDEAIKSLRIESHAIVVVENERLDEERENLRKLDSSFKVVNPPPAPEPPKTAKDREISQIIAAVPMTLEKAKLVHMAMKGLRWTDYSDPGKIAKAVKLVEED